MTTQAKISSEDSNFYGVYLLSCTSPQYLGDTYIGFTVDPVRRIKQHNKGVMAGGAYTTNRKGSWWVPHTVLFSRKIVDSGCLRRVVALRVVTDELSLFQGNDSRSPWFPKRQECSAVRVVVATPEEIKKIGPCTRKEVLLPSGNCSSFLDMNIIRVHFSTIRRMFLPGPHDGNEDLIAEDLTFAPLQVQEGDEIRIRATSTFRDAHYRPVEASVVDTPVAYTEVYQGPLHVRSKTFTHLLHQGISASLLKMKIRGKLSITLSTALGIMYSVLHSSYPLTISTIPLFRIHISNGFPGPYIWTMAEK